MAPAQKLDVNGTVRQTGAVNCALTSNASGDILCTSDEQLKHIHSSYMGGLAVINGINPILFNYHDEAYTHVGFSAQNVATVLPEAAPLQPSGFYGLDSNAVLAATVNAIKELDVKIALVGTEFAGIGESVGISAILDHMRSLLASGTLAMISAVEGIFEHLSVRELSVERIEAASAEMQTLEVHESAVFHNGLTLYDSLTGEPVCVSIEGGFLKSIPGRCLAEATETEEPDEGPEATGADDSVSDEIPTDDEVADGDVPAENPESIAETPTPEPTAPTSEPASPPSSPSESDETTVL
jgi:hypothetical protein